MAGTISESVPVISATISMTASGAREMLPKQAIIPTMTNGRGAVAEARHDGFEQAPDRGPDEGADHHARAEDAARTARTDREPGRRDAREGQDEHDPEGNRAGAAAPKVSWIQP